VSGVPRGRRRPVRSGAVLAVLALLGGLMSVGLESAPTAAQTVAPRPSPVGTTSTGNATPSQDALWFFANANSANTGVCVNPTASASLTSCFPTLPLDPNADTTTRAATDGTNMYFATSAGQSQMCPIDDLGSNCQYIFAGPFDGATGVTAIAAFEGSLYIGTEDTNAIYQCPNDLTYGGSDALPSECVTYDFPSGTGQADSMVVANDRLFVGMSSSGSSGVIYACNLDLTLGCSDAWDSFGKDGMSGDGNHAWSMAAGGGFLWVGLDDGIMWRCSTDEPNDCGDWNTAGSPIVSIAYDGGWLYAGVSNTFDDKTGDDKTNGVVWKCPAATANACGTVLTPGTYSGGAVGPTRSTQTVTAGAGNLFVNIRPALTTTPATYWETSPFTSTVGTTDGDACGIIDSGSFCAPWPMGLFYVPVGGITTTGALRVVITPWEALLERCAGAQEVTGLVTVSGPHRTEVERTVDLCAAREWRFGALDPGEYVVALRVGESVFTGPATVAGATTKVILLQPAAPSPVVIEPKFTG